MERMLVVVFDDESKAYEASRALNQLDAEGSISIHAESVITKNADGTVTEKKAEGDFPIRTAGGTAIGSVLGILGGPVGVAAGAAAGAAVGSLADLVRAGVDSDFLDEVAQRLTPAKHAVVADVSEEWVTPVDTRMEALRGEVFRTARRNFEDDERARDIKELKSEIAQMQAEHARVQADRKAKLKAKVDELNTRLQKKLEEAKQRSEQNKKETDAKVQALQQKAAKAKGEIKEAIDARVARIKKQHDESAAKIRGMVA